MNKMPACLLLIFALFALQGCSNQELEPDATLLGYDYFPIDIQQYWDYDIDQTLYYPNDPTVIEKFQIREVLESSFTSVDNKTSYKIQRYKRADSNLPWALDSVYAMYINQAQAFRAENNRTFLKLSFPLEAGKSWNGNAYNDLRRESCNVVFMDSTVKVNTFTFPKTLKVVLGNDSSLVSQDRRHELYARGVGLVYKYTKILNYCTESNCIGKGKVESGTIRTQTLINHGKL